WHHTCGGTRTLRPPSVPGTTAVPKSQLLARGSDHYARPMVAADLRPRGPYSLALSARRAGDATRRFRDGRLTAALPAGRGVAWQRPDGVVCLRATDDAALEQLRFCLAID